MTTKTWQATAPSNIALIKYMGKTDHSQNAPTNGSYSMTLEGFRSTVEVTEIAEATDLSEAKDKWEPLPTNYPLPGGVGDRFLSFFHRLKEGAGLTDKAFLIRSGNNFPSDCGLASSASSFAALTKTAEACFSELTGNAPRTTEELANISRTGSGSSCRSFFGPWCSWEGEKITAMESAMPALTDFVMVCGSGHKAVSSSEAHRRVATSPLMQSRLDRIPKRMEDSKAAIKSGDYESVRKIAWDDMWEMHSLFHTSTPPFFYFSPETIAVLEFVERTWKKGEIMPIATIDAGPNVHLLVPTSQAADFRSILSQELGDNRANGKPIRFLESDA